MISKLEVKSDSRVMEKFENYPEEVRPKLLKLRELILETASEMEGVTQLEETLKWGEPSYLTKFGSTIRMDHKAKTPDQYAIYFKCTSKLVPSFKAVYGDAFNYENNRAIVFQMEDEIEEGKLKQCIAAALRYHKVKALPMLGLL